MSGKYLYLLVVAVPIMKNAAEHVAYSGNVSACEGGTAVFHINESETREAGQLKFARWTHNDFEIIGAKQMLPVYTFGSRITYNWPTDPGFTISEVKATDSGKYKCIKSFDEGQDETYLWTLEVTGDDAKKRAKRDLSDLISQRDRTECVWEKGTVNIVAANEPIPETFKRIVWIHNDSTTFTISSSKCTKTKDTTDFGGRISFWSNCTGLTIVQAKLKDQGNFTRIITLKNGTDDTSKWILNVKELTTRNFNITILIGPSGGITLKCGESMGLNATYRWIFSKTTGRENETSTGHELPLPSIPQKGSVFCQRQSDCTSSLPYSFSSGEVPEERGIHTAAVVVPIIVIMIIIIIIIIIVIIIIVTVILLCKRRRERERNSRKTGGGKTDSGVQEKMLSNSQPTSA